MKILIAEDDVTSRTILTAMLTKSGHKVTACVDGNHAFEAVQNDDDLQLAVLDWMMPGLDGIGFCKKIRREYKSKYVL
ncbi:MAG: response regulator [Thermodesulfobacteriota bacterium]|nr:response regulator [Thermodesulfobacteriota bacterium]